MERRYTLGGSLRHAARLAAVQVLYQIEQSEISVSAAIEQFNTWYLVEDEVEEDDEAQSKLLVDFPFFTRIVEGVCQYQESLDRAITVHLAQEWTLERLPSVLYIILKAATYEMGHEEVPFPVIINEYIEIAKDFFVDSEVSFVNGLLDKVRLDIQNHPA